MHALLHHFVVTLWSHFLQVLELGGSACPCLQKARVPHCTCHAFLPRFDLGRDAHLSYLPLRALSPHNLHLVPHSWSHTSATLSRPGSIWAGTRSPVLSVAGALSPRTLCSVPHSWPHTPCHTFSPRFDLGRDAHLSYLPLVPLTSHTPSCSTLSAHTSATLPPATLYRPGSTWAGTRTSPTCHWRTSTRGCWWRQRLRWGPRSASGR